MTRANAKSRMAYKIVEKNGAWTWSVEAEGRLVAVGSRRTSAQARADALKFCFPVADKLDA